MGVEGKISFQTFCGVSTLETMDEIRHIPVCDNYCAENVVDCQVCKAIHDTIINNYLESKNP
jgi:hypothetical protein